MSGWSSSWIVEKSSRRKEAKEWQNLWDILKWHFYVFVSTLMSLKWRQVNRKMTWLCYHLSHLPDIGGSFTLGASAVPHLRTFSPHWWEALVVLARSTTELELRVEIREPFVLESSSCVSSVNSQFCKLTRKLQQKDLGIHHDSLANNSLQEPCIFPPVLSVPPWCAVAFDTGL